MIRRRTAIAALAIAAASAPGHADVKISTGATQHMSCSDGTCVPTAARAVLNADDLQNDLSQFGNVTVATTGSGVEANNIVVDAAFSSPDSTSLRLDAHEAITIDAAVSIGSGTAELELQSGEALSFGPKGHITFGNLSDIFGMNGVIFTLVGSVQGLAGAVAGNPSGAFALANDYDAGQGGTYTSSPVATPLTGTVEGLGNTISHLAIRARTRDTSVALFSQIGTSGEGGGTVSDLRLVKASVSAGRGSAAILAVTNYGFLSEDGVAGTVKGSEAAGGIVNANEGSGTVAASVSNAAVTVLESKLESFGGGIAGRNVGTITTSYATGIINVAYGVSAGAGGVAGANFGTIDSSFATGAVSASGEGDAGVGGLVGLQDGTVSNCYAGGAVTGTLGDFGGLNGFENPEYNGGTTSSSYSTGSVSGGGSQSYLGGFVGYVYGANGTNDDYWDTDTSGITNLGQGAGNVSNYPGITGPSTSQFQSDLPAGFDPNIWAENPTINNGFPYLIANPPPK